MGQITADQSQQIMALLSTNVDWSKIDFEALDLQNSVVRNPTEAGSQFQRFLMNGCRVIIMLATIIINRAKKFNPAEFIGEGWKIWRGLACEQGLEGVEEQDENSLVLNQIDLSEKVKLVSTLKKGETSITGEENLLRLKEIGYTRLDAAIFYHLWENQHLIPESWKERVNGNIKFIYFDGTILRDPDGYRYVLCLYWRGGRWSWRALWLDNHRDADGLSAVLAK